MFEWLKSLGDSVWDVIHVLVALALFAVIGVPLGQWFWTWVGANALPFIALAVVAGGAAMARKSS